MPRRAYSYRRISTGGRQARGDGLRRQDWAASICTAKGWLLDTSLSYVDRGVSAFRGKNSTVGALAQFLDDVERGRIPSGSVLIIESIDRLSRQQIDEAYDLFRKILRAGITIYTKEPEREYDLASCANMLGILEPLFIMARAHEESNTKSMRVEQVWQQRQAAAVSSKRPFGRGCPAWIRLVGGAYELISRHAETIQQIHAWAQDGLGALRITQQLKAGKFPMLGKSRWTVPYVQQLMKSRRVIGEFEPASRKNGKRVFSGKPIAGYYPAAISEECWTATQHAVASRKTRRPGRPGLDRNLFTSLVNHADSGHPLSLCGNSHSTYLAAYTYAPEGKCVTVPYDRFENAVLQAIRELAPRDVLLPNADFNRRDQEIANVTRQLTAADFRLQAVQQAISDPDQPPESLPTLIASVRDLTAAKALLARKLDKLKFDSHNCHADNLAEAHSLVDLLRTAPPATAQTIRRRIKVRLGSLLDSIWITVQVIKRTCRIVHVQMFLASGRRRYFQILPPAGAARDLAPWDLSKVDLRIWQKSDVAHGAIAAQPIG